MPAIAVNKSNAQELWAAGLISATNVSIATNVWAETPQSSEAAKHFLDTAWFNSRNSLHTVILKGGFNAVRVFLELDRCHVGDVVRDEVAEIAQRGWADTTCKRLKLRDWVIPNFELLATQLDNLLLLCHRLGVGLIVCPGSFHSGAQGRLWREKDLHDQLVAFWSRTAERWKPDSRHPERQALIAWELLNEPTPGEYVVELPDKTKVVRRYSYAEMQDPIRPTQNYRALMERCVTAIRLFDAQTPVMVSGIDGGLDLDYFISPSVGLVQDPINKIVYTAHFYEPYSYTHQGVYGETYHAIGMRYPNFRLDATEWIDGVAVKFSRDYKANPQVAMQGAFERWGRFKSICNAPVFVGELSVCSTAYLKRVQEAVNVNTGKLQFAWGSRIEPDHAARAVYGLGYDAESDRGLLILSEGLNIWPITRVDEFGRVWGENTVTLEIKPLPRQGAYQRNDDGTINVDSVTAWEDIGAYGNLGKQNNVTLTTNCYASTDPVSGDHNNVISFKWPKDKPKPTANMGVPLSGLTVTLQTTNAQGQLESKTLMADGPGSKHASLVKLSGERPLAYIQIEMDAAMVEAQEASRPLWTRDVLRECNRRGMSWAWFCEIDTIDTYLYAAGYWQVDIAGGKLRTLVRRAAHQSYE